VRFAADERRRARAAGNRALPCPPPSEPRRGKVSNPVVEDPIPGTCHPPNRHDHLCPGPWRLEAWPRLTTRGQIGTTSSCSSFPTSPEPTPPSPIPPPRPSTPPDPPPSRTHQISTRFLNPNSSNPSCSSGGSKPVAAPAESTPGGFDLSHLWGRSSRSGRCQVVPILVDSCHTLKFPISGCE
jgi:hypothetical protein